MLLVLADRAEEALTDEEGNQHAIRHVLGEKRGLRPPPRPLSLKRWSSGPFYTRVFNCLRRREGAARRRPATVRSGLYCCRFSFSSTLFWSFSCVSWESVNCGRVACERGAWLGLESSVYIRISGRHPCSCSDPTCGGLDKQCWWSVGLPRGLEGWSQVKSSQECQVATVHKLAS